MEPILFLPTMHDNQTEFPGMLFENDSVRAKPPGSSTVVPLAETVAEERIFIQRSVTVAYVESLTVVEPFRRFAMSPS
jgi:hypothetical protein